MAETEMTPQAEAWYGESAFEKIERRIRKEMEARIHYYARRTDQIDERLRELAREWNLERVVQANVAILSFSGLMLGAVHRKWHLVSALAAACLIQHAVEGWSPPLIVCRRLGIRTSREINHERFALKALRGDFDNVRKDGEENPEARAQRAIEAANSYA